MQEKIKQEIVKAIKVKDQMRLDTLRSISSAFTTELLNLKRTPQDKLSDEESIKVIQRLAKQTKESISSFETGNRNDLVDIEKAQLKILEEFLPHMMTEEEIEKFVINKLKNMDKLDQTKTGLIVGLCMKELSGKADGFMVKSKVEKIIKSI